MKFEDYSLQVVDWKLLLTAKIFLSFWILVEIIISYWLATYVYRSECIGAQIIYVTCLKLFRALNTYVQLNVALALICYKIDMYFSS